MAFKTVDRELVRFLLAHGQGQHAVELANLWAEISYWNSRQERFVAGAYERTWGTSEDRLRKLLKRLESLGGITRTGPTHWPETIANPMPWGGEGARVSRGHSESESLSESESTIRGLTPEQQQQVIDTYCQLAPDHWVKPKALSAAMKPVVAGYVKRAGGFDAFLLELRWQLKRIGTSPMAKPGTSKCTIVTLLGSSKTQDKERWAKWSAEHGDLSSDPDSLDTLKPEHPDWHPPHNQNALDSGLIALKDNARRPHAPKEEGLKFYADWFKRSA